MAINSKQEIHHLKQLKNMAFGKRLAYIIATKGISKKWLAEQLGISKQYLNFLLHDSVKPKFVDKFAELLEVDPQWIEKGVGTPLVERLTLPIITNAILLGQAALDEAATIDFFSTTETFLAYKLEDDSSFPPCIENSILIFDTKKQPINQNYVLLKIENNIFVRQYLVENNNICFKASNYKHKTFLNPEATILGVLIEVRYQLN